MSLPTFTALAAAGEGVETFLKTCQPSLGGCGFAAAYTDLQHSLNVIKKDSE